MGFTAVLMMIVLPRFMLLTARTFYSPGEHQSNHSVRS